MRDFSFLSYLFYFFFIVNLLCSFISAIQFFSYFCNTECLFPFLNITPFALFFIIGIVTHITTSIHQKYHFQGIAVQFPFHLIKHCLPFQLVLFFIFHTLTFSIRARFGVLPLSAPCFRHE